VRESGWVSGDGHEAGNDALVCFKTRRWWRLFFITGARVSPPRQGDGFWYLGVEGVSWLHLAGEW